MEMNRISPEVMHQYHELKSDCPQIELSNMSLWEASRIFDLAQKLCAGMDFEPSLFEGDTGCPHVVVHCRTTSKRLDVEISPNGLEYRTITYQDLSSMENYGPWSADLDWLKALL